MELTNHQLLDILQITNGTFPTGTFSHSFGLETYIRQNIITDAKTLKQTMKCFIFGQFLYADLLAIRKIYETNEDIKRIDNILNTQGMAKETREAGRRIGVQTLKIYLELFDFVDLKNYYELIKQKQCSGNPALAFGLLAKNLNIDLTQALYIHSYATVSTIVQNCVRAIPLGQIEGQKVMLEIKKEYFDDLIKLAYSADMSKEFCKNNPAFEIAQMNHEEVLVRLFMS